MDTFTVKVKMLNEHELQEVDENDCCGNGCVNCILVVKPKTKNEIKQNRNKTNIILNYHKYNLINKNQHNTISNEFWDLHFAYADKSKSADCVLEIPAGHHIMMRATPNCNADNEKTKILRPYSPFWVHATNLEFKILVNLKPNGPMSQYIDKLVEGDEVEFRGPMGTFEHSIDLEAKKYIFMVTQGVAIAPTLPIIEEILNNEDDLCRIFHFSCFRNFNEIFFRDRLCAYNKYWNFNGRIYLAHENCGLDACTQHGSCTDQCETFRSHVKYKEQVYSQRFDGAAFAEVYNGISSAFEKIIILCGTRHFQDYFYDCINNMEFNVKKENIFLF